MLLLYYYDETFFRVSYLSIVGSRSVSSLLLLVRGFFIDGGFLHVDLMIASSIADIRGLISGFGESYKYYRWLLGFRWPYVC